MSHPAVPFSAAAPAVIVPLVVTDPGALAPAAAALRGLPIDVVEWRVDHLRSVAEAPGGGAVSAAVEALRVLAHELPGVPVLATVRTVAEGGEWSVGADLYAEVVSALAESGAAALIDVEFRHPRFREIAAASHSVGAAVMASAHDFEATPPEAEIVALLAAMEKSGADVAKVAVLPHSRADVVTLLSATERRFREATRPIVTVSMGALGAVSRLGGCAFGSAATFAVVGTASAPGQLPLVEVRSALAALTP